MSRPSLPPSLFPLLTLLTFSSLLNPSSPATDSFIYGGCTPQKYTRGSPFESNLNSLFASFINSATLYSYNNFSSAGFSAQEAIYGLYQCRGDLSIPDCSTCVSHSVTQLSTLCSTTTGGVVMLQGCFIKYDNVPFLGIEDKTVAFKKCGPSMGYNSDDMSRKDAVLAGLSSGGGSYRVGGSGVVQGMAQCVGDLTAGECQDCLSEAVGRLKSECAMAASGDVFLAKCYVRYSVIGVYSKAGRVEGFYHPGWWFLVLGFISLGFDYGCLCGLSSF